MSKLAIVIPYYKIDFFEETIKSIASQSNQDFVLYIGNDASPDDPLPVIEQYLKKEDYQYFNYSDNLGGKNLALQWERILHNVQEEWFQILGDDDVISEHFVGAFHHTLPALEEKKITAVKFVHEWIDENGSLIEIFDYKTELLDSVDFIIRKYKGELKSSLSENIFQTAMYCKYHFEKLPLAWGSDEIALLTFSGYGKILYNRNAKVQVRISTSSISGSDSMDQVKEYATHCFREKIITKHARYFPVPFIEEITQVYLAYCHLRRQNASYKVALFFLKHWKMKEFLQTVKKIYYLNKMAESHRIS